MNKWLRLGYLVQCLVALGAHCTSAAAQDIWIEQVTLVSPERSSPMTDATVHVRGDRIVSISRHSESGAAGRSGTAFQVIDGRGLYLAPGLIDTHVHVGEIAGMTSAQEQAHPDLARAAREQIPRSYLYFGFTTLVDLIATPAQATQWQG